MLLDIAVSIVAIVLAGTVLTEFVHFWICSGNGLMGDIVDKPCNESEKVLLRQYSCIAASLAKKIGAPKPVVVLAKQSYRMAFFPTILFRTPLLFLGRGVGKWPEQVLEAGIAHEMGHWKQRHRPLELVNYVCLLFHRLADVAVSLIRSVISIFPRRLLSVECAADSIAAGLVGNDAMINVLRKYHRRLHGQGSPKHRARDSVLELETRIVRLGGTTPANEPCKTDCSGNDAAIPVWLL